MKANGRKRAVVLLGAGASVEYKVPSTQELTSLIEHEVLSDGWLKITGGDKAFTLIKKELEEYLTSYSFEQIYHCIHELIYLNAPTPSAVDEYRPLLYPFVKNSNGLSDRALRSLANTVIKAIYKSVSDSCSKNILSLDPFRGFINNLGTDYITRIYTTNYDDFPLQACPNLYTGFEMEKKSGPKKFEIDKFWKKEDLDSLFYLHGSVHMGFPSPDMSSDDDMGSLYWFDDRDEALKCCLFSGSDNRRMDGSSYLRTSIITGLDKLSRLQQRPLSHFYSGLARDLMSADVIFVIGSGLTDLHLNTWLKEARRRAELPPILFIDFWKNGYLDEFERKEIEMLHALRIKASRHYGYERIGNGWIASKDKSAAIWEKGFQSFLNAPEELSLAMRQLGL